MKARAALIVVLLALSSIFTSILPFPTAYAACPPDCSASIGVSPATVSPGGTVTLTIFYGASVPSESETLTSIQVCSPGTMDGPCPAGSTVYSYLGGLPTFSCDADQDCAGGMTITYPSTSPGTCSITAGSGTCTLSDASCSAPCWTEGANTEGGGYGVLIQYASSAAPGALLAGGNNFSTIPASNSVSCVAPTVVADGAAICTVSVTEAATAAVGNAATASAAPAGSVSFSSSMPGTFIGSDCTLKAVSSSTSRCSVIYSPSLGSEGTNDITASYGGTSNPFHLTVEKRMTKVAVSPQTISIAPGSSVLLTALVIDSTGGTKSAPTGTVTWGDLHAGGTFTAQSCTLSVFNTDMSTCAIHYTTPASGKGVLIVGLYTGDGDYKAGLGFSIIVR